MSLAEQQNKRDQLQKKVTKLQAEEDINVIIYSQQIEVMQHTNLKLREDLAKHKEHAQDALKTAQSNIN